MKKIVLVATLISILLMSGCSSKNPKIEGSIDNMNYKETEEITNYVKIEMKNSGDIMLLELYPDIIVLLKGL